MNIARILACLSAALALVSCVTPPAPRLTLAHSFDPAQVAWFNAPGNATLAGQALLRTRGGEARTCAGLPVELIPVSDYASERMATVFGSAGSGFFDIRTTPPAFDNDAATGAAAYAQMTRKTICDAQGNFTFSELPAGSYYIVALVVWNLPGGARQGGALMQLVQASDGKTARVILTQ